MDDLNIIEPRRVISKFKSAFLLTFGAENETRTRSYKQLYSNLLQSVAQNSSRKCRTFRLIMQGIIAKQSLPVIP